QFEKNFGFGVAGDDFLYVFILGVMADDVDVVMIFGRGAQEADATDVDLLDGFGQSGFRVGYGFLERIEGNDDVIDRANALLLQGFEIGWHITAGEDAGENFGVEGFYATTEDFFLTGI